MSDFLLHCFTFTFDEGSAFGYYNFLPNSSSCVDTSSLQAVMCCASVYWRHLVGNFIKLYHYIEKDTTYYGRLAGNLCTVNAINICVVTFLQRHSHTGHILAPWQHPHVLKVLLGSSSKSQSKCLNNRYIADLIFPYITLYFKFLSIGYVTEVKFPSGR